MTKKEMRLVAQHTRKDLIGKSVCISEKLGTFQKSGSNWLYVAGWTYEGDLVVTRFGEVLGEV